MFCPKCGSKNAEASRYCSQCATALIQSIAPVVPATPAQKKHSSRILFAWIFGGVALLVILAVSISDTPDHPTETIRPTNPAPIEQAAPAKASTGNIANDRLLALSEREQAFALGVVLNSGCTGDRAFYMGMLARDHSAFWSVHCASAESYEVELSADAVGSTRVLECSVLKALGAGKCFEKFKGQ